MTPATPYRFDVVTIFEPLMAGYLNGSMLGRAQDAGHIAVGYANPRDFTGDVHRTVDDSPYGGGAGMVMKPEPLYRAITSVRQAHAPARTVLLSAAGRRFDQRVAAEYAALGSLCLVCGRYEGVDERIATHVVDEELSIGDFVLTGGELGAMVVIDAVSRLLPGVLGHKDGAANESFSDHLLLEHPTFTRPRTWRGHDIPEALLSGHHAKIDAWRHAQRELRTQQRRPDLWSRHLANERGALVPQTAVDDAPTEATS